MHSFKTLLTLSALVLGAALPLTGLAQSTPVLTDGEVRKLDKDTGKLTLRHGEIKHLDMPPMTMVFTVKDARLLDTVKAGDQIRFMATHENGKMVVTEIQPAR